MKLSPPHLSSSFLLAFCFVVSAFLFPAPSRANLIDIRSNNAQSGGDGTGFFTGSIDYEYTSSSKATFTVVLKNTTAAGGHFLTGFLFNNPNPSDITGITHYTTSSNGSNFDNLGTGGQNGINGQPFGSFDFGAATGGSWEGGGNPSKGLAPGQSATFTFTFTGNNLNTITTQDFVNASSSGGQFFAVRYRGGVNSDKEPGEVIPFTPTPEPGSFVLGVLLGSSLLGFWGVLQRRKMSAVVA